MSEQTPTQLAVKYAVALMEQRLPVEGPANKPLVQAHIDAVLALTARCEALEISWIGWSPTADNVNALPAPVKSYVHELETRCDPSGELRELVIARDTCHALDARCEALTAERDRLLAEKQADKDSFDNALAQFSAGYTQALDDAVKGTKP